MSVFSRPAPVDSPQPFSLNTCMKAQSDHFSGLIRVDDEFKDHYIDSILSHVFTIRYTNRRDQMQFPSAHQQFTTISQAIWKWRSTTTRSWG